MVAVAAISRFASLHDSIRSGWLGEPDWVAGVEHTIATGLHRGLDYGERDRFTTAYFHHPDDLLRELADAGLAQEVVVSVEGPATFMSSLDDQLDDPARRNVLLRWLRRVETEPSLLGAGGHLIGLATVRGTD